MSESTFKGYFKQAGPRIIQADPELAKSMAAKLATFVTSPEAKEEIAHFADIPAFQPTTAYQLGTGVGYVQAAYIGDILLPTWVGGRNEQASYPVFGGEKFVSDHNVIALAARPRRIDVTIDWRNVQVKVHSLEVATDRRELDAASLLPIALDSYKLDVLKTQLANEREVEQATFVRDPNHYASANKATLTGSTANGTAQWSDPNGWPIDNVYKAKAAMRKSKMRCVPDTFWMSDDVFQSLSFSTQIKELVKYSGTKMDIGTGVPAAALAALFNMRLVIGGAGTSGFAGGAITDTWGEDAGLLCTAAGQVIAPRFGLTVGLAGYPSATSYEEQQIGPKGGTVQKLSDAWSLELTSPKGDTESTAGFLWTTASASL